METENDKKKAFAQDTVHKGSWTLNLSITNAALFTLICTIASLIVGNFFLAKYVEPEWVSDLKQEEKSLLFIGSGTVYNYLDSRYHISKEENYASMPLPTYAALKTLREEKKPPVKSGIPDKKYSWIIMSALRAEDTLIMGESETKEFTKESGVGKIMELYLTGDNMKVILYPFDSFSAYISGDNVITIDELKRIIEDRNKIDYMIFRTSEGSSTRNLFEQKIGKIDEQKSCFFDMHTKFSTFMNYNKKFIILCSDIYAPDIQNLPKDYKSYMFVDNEQQPLKKHLFLYFAAYWKNKDNSELCIPEQTERFINKVRPDFKVADDKCPTLIVRDGQFKKAE